MIAQSFDVVFGFFFHILKERLVPGIHTASEHKVLPDQQSVFITELIKNIFFIYTAAPNAQHVHVRFYCCGNFMPIPLLGYFCGEAVIWNMIGTFGEDGNSIQRKRKRSSFGITLPNQFNTAESVFYTFANLYFRSMQQFRLEGI
ncbi:hypothetical protein D3C75_688820 [compost metagenome]